jgi:hypothetical protein
MENDREEYLESARGFCKFTKDWTKAKIYTNYAQAYNTAWNITSRFGWEFEVC